MTKKKTITKKRPAGPDLNKEVEAVKAVSNALKGLNKKAQERVLVYAEAVVKDEYLDRIY